MSISVLCPYLSGSELRLEKDNATIKFETIEQNKSEYIKLNDLLKPLSVKSYYNRPLHKISFTFNKNIFSLSPVSNAVAVNGAVQFFDKPVLVKKGVVYVSKEALVYMSTFLSYNFIKKLVVIDPGHGGGGDDGLGAKAVLDKKDIYEKQITLEFSEYLGEALKKLGYQVSFTRTKDKKIPLAERTKTANADGAKAFISLHANSSTDPLVKGADVFYMSEEAEDSYSKLVAEKENMLLGGKKTEKDVNDILKSMIVSGHIKESAMLAYEISTSLPSDVISRGVKKAPFAVLHTAYMPSVLVELGFMSNEADLRNMLNKDWISSTSYSMAKGIDSYFRKSKEE